MHSHTVRTSLSIVVFLIYALFGILPANTSRAMQTLKLASTPRNPPPVDKVQDLPQQIEQLEKLSWVAWQNHDADFFKQFLSADHVEVGVGGPTTKDAVVAGVGSGICTVRSYAIDHFTFTQFSATTAVLTYRAQQDTLCNGVAVPSPVWATSVYVFRDNRWMNAVYAHTTIPTTK